MYLMFVVKEKKMNNKEFKAAFDYLVEEKGLDEELIKETIDVDIEFDMPK